MLVYCGIFTVFIIMATYQIPAPSPMSFKGDIVENWKEFETAWADYLVATELDKKLKTADNQPDPAGQTVVAATLCSVIGADCKKVLNNLPDLTAADRRNPDRIIEVLRNYFLPQRNVLYERFMFNSTNQKAGEAIDQFVLRLRQLAEPCEFGDLKNSLIRDRIVIGTSDESGRERLLRERPVPDLNTCIEKLRAAEVSRSHREVMAGTASASVDHISRRKQGSKRQGRSQPKPKSKPQGQGQSTQNHGGKKPNQGQDGKKCRYCGGSIHKRDECPAKNRVSKLPKSRSLRESL